MMPLAHAQISDGQVATVMKYSTWKYGVPPCAKYCGETPQTCQDRGFISHDNYVFWHDKNSGMCKSVTIVSTAPVCISHQRRRARIDIFLYLLLY